MPYKLVGNKIMHKKDGKWSIKQKCSSRENAIKALRLLYAIENETINKRGGK